MSTDDSPGGTETDLERAVGTATKNATRNIQKRRRLAELYAKGTNIRFGAEGVVEAEDKFTDEDVVIWVSPPNPLQRDMAIREAQGARSRAILRARREDESSESAQVRAFLAGMDDETLVEYVLTLTQADRVNEAQRRVLALDKWENFDELRDGMRQWEEAGSPDTDEWRDLIDKDIEFGKDIEAEGVRLRESDKESLALQGRAVLEKKALDRRVDLLGTAEFVRAYEEWMLYYACRDDEDHNQMFFESPTQIHEYPEFIEEKLTEAMNAFITDVGDAKN